jgi:hypothetical protein
MVEKRPGLNVLAATAYLCLTLIRIRNLAFSKPGSGIGLTGFVILRIRNGLYVDTDPAINLNSDLDSIQIWIRSRSGFDPDLDSDPGFSIMFTFLLLLFQPL